METLKMEREKEKALWHCSNSISKVINRHHD